MTMFLAVALFLLTAGGMFVLSALLRNPYSQQGSPDAVNLAVLQDQLKELDTDLANGVIDQANYVLASADLNKRIANGTLSAQPAAKPVPNQPVSVILIGFSVPIAALVLYWFLGTPAGLDVDDAAITPNRQQSAQVDDVDRATLLQQVKNNPDDAQSWDMLASSYHKSGQYQAAANAYAQLVRLVPDNADMLADYADTLAMAQNKTLRGEPEQIIARALRIDPNNIKGLSLSASAAFEQQDYQKAIDQWNKILPQVAAGSDVARSVESDIAEAKSLAGAAATMRQTADGAVEATSTPTTPSKTLQGVVQLDKALLNQTNPNATVFIFARAEQGPRFPLAVLKKQVKDLPVNFVLDDTMGMMPNAKLSDYPLVVVGARISKSGSATAEPGDLEGAGAPVKPGSTDLRIVIDTVRQAR